MEKSVYVFSPIKSRRAFEQVADNIKQMIFKGAFKPNDRLPTEQSLAQQFEVGRQSIREALRQLELSGFVRIHKGGGGGAFVSNEVNFTIRDLFLDSFQMHNASLEDLTLCRIEVERLVLNHVLDNIDDGELKALRENIAEAQALIDSGKSALEANVRFHKLLARASKNFAYEVIMECIMAVHKYFLLKYEPSLETSKNVLLSHMEILDAVESRNRELAQSLFESHLLDVQRRLIDETS